MFSVRFICSKQTIYKINDLLIFKNYNNKQHNKIKKQSHIIHIARIKFFLVGLHQ